LSKSFSKGSAKPVLVLIPVNTQPEEEDHRLLHDALKLQLPAQPKPRSTAAGKLADLSSL
jgi:hypothetical protein